MSSNPLQPPQLPPSRLFYRIGEVSRLTGLEQYVLRYWETEFSQIRPEKGKTGQRRYTKKDLDNILLIKQLLYKEGFTIAGARKKLNGRVERDNAEAVIESAKKDLRAILELID
jgi:DNA-binding transcriptional MerR regulator